MGFIMVRRLDAPPIFFFFLKEHRDPATRQAVVMDIKTNSFCSSGMHLPNGSFVTFGGNDGVGPTGVAGSQKNPDGTGAWDSVYQDFDGRKSIRIVNPCNPGDDLTSAQCGWFDEPTLLSMKARRWYSAAEPTGDGTIVIMGGFVNGGFINRQWPVTDPIASNGQAENTYEYFPAKDGDPQLVQFLIKTSGLSAYAHTYLMPSGKMLVQANVSTSEFCLLVESLSFFDVHFVLSALGSCGQRRNTPARHAQAYCSRVPCLWRCGHASSYTGQ